MQLRSHTHMRLSRTQRHARPAGPATRQARVAPLLRPQPVRPTHRRAPPTAAVETTTVATTKATTFGNGNPTSKSAGEWFFTESGQKGWVEAMELDTLTPDMPALLKEMSISYDPDKLAASLSNKWPQVYSRAVRIAASLGGFIASVVQDYVFGGLERNMPQRAQELTTLMSDLGPSFVKIGQALSARPDLLPKTYLEALSQLQDRLPSFPTDIAHAVIEEELGRPLTALFATLSPEPVAAASLGQVYRGRLLTGEEVAVKVQRPSIGESIAVDMLLLRRLMAAVDANLPLVTSLPLQALVPLVDEFAGKLFSELDYVQEGRNAERFQELYGAMPRVRTPGIYWGFTGRRVLTMEWIEGVKLTNRVAMEAAGLSVIDFVDVGIECTLRQLLEHGYFHADPHPGNLLATTSGDLVYLDFGMMSEAPEYARYAIMAHVVHLVNRDYRAMCRDYYTLQFMDRSVDTSPIEPALAAFFDDVLDQSVAQLNFKAIVDGLGEVLFQFPFKVPAYYALILRSLTVLEGLALQADPSYKLLGRAYPYMARRLLTDPAPELRESFEDLVVQDGKLRWNRLENLLREGSKSRDFDPAQLWLLAEWLLSPSGVSVRGTVATEAVRMLDALAAADVRENIAARTGSRWVAERLVPMQPTDEVAQERARQLQEVLQQRLSSDGPPLALPSLSSTSLANGPQGLFSAAASVSEWLQSLQGQAASAWPRLSQLLQQPSAQELVRQVAAQLTQRFAARTIKFVAGAQELQASLPPPGPPSQPQPPQ